VQDCQHQLVMVSGCPECKPDGILSISGLNRTNLLRKREKPLF